MLEDGRHCGVGEHPLVERRHLQLKNMREITRIQYGEDTSKIVEYLRLLPHAGEGAICSACCGVYRCRSRGRRRVAAVDGKTMEPVLDEARNEKAFGLAHPFLDRGLLGSEDTAVNATSAANATCAAVASDAAATTIAADARHHARVGHGPNDGLDAEDHRLEKLLVLAQRLGERLLAGGCGRVALEMRGRRLELGAEFPSAGGRLCTGGS